MFGIGKGILSLLKEGGGFLKDYVKGRFVPAALQTTRTDEGLEYLAKHHKLQQESLQHLRNQLEARGKRLSREAQDIIDSISGPKSASGSIAKPGATQREMNKIFQQVRELDKEKNILDDILSRGLEGLDADGIAAFEYQREKVVGLLKALIPVVGAGATGMYWGGRLEDANPNFYDPKIDMFRTQEPEDAIEEMEEATQTKSDLWGPKVAEGLMDIISPIPRQ